MVPVDVWRLRRDSDNLKALGRQVARLLRALVVEDGSRRVGGEAVAPPKGALLLCHRDTRIHVTAGYSSGIVCIRHSGLSILTPRIRADD